MYRFLCEHKFSFFLGIYFWMGLWSHTFIICLHVWLHNPIQKHLPEKFGSAQEIWLLIYGFIINCQTAFQSDYTVLILTNNIWGFHVFWVNFCGWYKICRARLLGFLFTYGKSRSICWNDYPFFIALSLLICQSSVDYIWIGPFLYSQFCLSNLPSFYS